MITTTQPQATTPAGSLDDRIAAVCGHLNACYAALVELIREVIATEAWHGLGIRSVEQWITWRTGLSANHAHALVEVAEAAETHPRVTEAFGAGELSVDQARLAVRAQPEHDADVAEWAKVMTLSQLRLAVRASTASAADRERIEQREQPEQPGSDEPVASPREHFSLVQDEDGTWRVHGLLDADHGAIVDAALCEARDRLFREGDRDVTWADALVDIAERSFGAAPLERRERFRPNIFCDPEHSPRATWITGIAVPDAIAKLCTCDGTLSPVFVAEGRPVSVGRSLRIVPERTRRVVLHRDVQCRNPLCGRRHGLEVHHIVHWADGGPTDTANLVVLCRRCHRDHHLGRLHLTGNADETDGVVFRDEGGRIIDTATHAAKPPGRAPDPRRPYRHPCGERLQRWAVQFNPPQPAAN
jgi:HNH endonuclease/Domain of unknown function (DUF222)